MKKILHVPITKEIYSIFRIKKYKLFQYWYTLLEKNVPFVYCLGDTTEIPICNTYQKLLEKFSSSINASDKKNENEKTFSPSYEIYTERIFCNITQEH